MPPIAPHVPGARARLAGCVALCLVAAALLGGCGSSTPTLRTGDRSIRQDLARGVRAIRTTHDRHRLRAELLRVVAHLRRLHGTTETARQGQELALQGFDATLKGTRSQLDFVEKDSGEVAAATRDAKRADHYLRLGASRLRAAGRAFGLRIGKLNGY